MYMIPLFIHLKSDLCLLRGLSQSASVCALHNNSYVGVPNAVCSNCNANFIPLIDMKRIYAEQKNTELILYVLQSMFLYGLCFK
jgi:hypothetical protein